MTIREIIVNKIFSGQWLTAVIITLTYSFTFLGVIVLTGMKILSPDFLMGYLTGLGTLVLKIVGDYYNRDRSKENGGK